MTDELATSSTTPENHIALLPRWYRRVVLALLMYAFLVVFLMVLTTPGWHMVFWLVAGLGIQMGMLTLASLTDPKRGR